MTWRTAARLAVAIARIPLESISLLFANKDVGGHTRTLQITF
jgi:hypothetical protein